MTEKRDPVIRAAMVAIGFASPDPLPFDELERSALSRVEPRTPRRARNLAVAFAATVAVLVLIGVPAWLLLQGRAQSPIGSEPTTIPPTTRVPSTVTTSPSAPSLPPTSTTTLPSTTTTVPPPAGLDVRFDTEIVFGYDENNVWDVGTFIASGPAVDERLVCTEGTIDLSRFDTGLGTWRAEVRYICGDGTGTFHLGFDLAGSYVDGSYTESGTWEVVYGTGPYADLNGSGTDATTSPEPDRYLSVQTGRIAPSGESER